MRPGTTARSVRIPDALWQAFVAACQQNGTDASTVLRRSAERYVARQAKKGKP